MPRVKMQDMVSSQSFVGNTTAQYITPTTPLAVGLTSDLTVGAWVKLGPKNVAGNNDSHCIGTFNFNYGSNWGYNFTVRASDGSLNLYSGSTSSGTSAGIVPYNVWAFLVIEMVGTSANIYVNDMVTPRTTITVTRKADSALFTRFASEGTGTSAAERRVRGNIKTIFATNSVLTADQKYAIMNGTGVPPVSLLYKLDENTGSTATDSSGNGNHGTITNGTWSTDTPTKLRTATTNRVAVQDIKSSLSFNGTSSKVALTQTAGLPLYSSNTAYTILAWVKPSNNLGAQINTIYADGSTAGTSPFFCININAASGNHNIGFFIRDDAAATVMSYNTAIKLNKNQWNRVAFVDNNGVVRVYINGLLDTNSSAGLMDYTRTGAFTMNTSTWGAATRNTTTFYLNGSLSNSRLYKSALTLAQTELAFNGGEPDAANRVGKYDFQEGAGTTAYDTSGNNNHGTISSGSFTSGVPTKKREVVGGNLVYNGDFEYAPPFVAATTTSSRWIDGTAAGSTNTANIFGWSVASGVTGTIGAQFDNTVSHSGNRSLKLTIDANSLMNVGHALSQSAANVKLYAIPVLPNTSYTISGFIKTDWLSGSATRGAYIRSEQFTGAGASITSIDHGYFNTTVDWTPITANATFTTGATARYIVVQCAAHSTAGTTTLNGSAWFDDIDLRPTVNTTRTAV